MRATLHPGVTSQFYTLLGEAQYTLNQQLPADLEHYLVNLLVTFLDKSDWLNQPVGLRFLESCASTRTSALLKDVGDTCLITSGLFPEYRNHRGVSRTYYMTLGQTAFQQYAQQLTPSNATLFSHLSTDFPLLSDILLAMRQRPSNFQ